MKRERRIGAPAAVSSKPPYRDNAAVSMKPPQSAQLPPHRNEVI